MLARCRIFKDFHSTSAGEFLINLQFLDWCNRWMNKRTNLGRLADYERGIGPSWNSLFSSWYGPLIFEKVGTSQEKSRNFLLSSQCAPSSTSQANGTQGNRIPGLNLRWLICYNNSWKGKYGSLLRFQPINPHDRAMSQEFLFQKHPCKVHTTSFQFCKEMFQNQDDLYLEPSTVSG